MNNLMLPRSIRICKSVEMREIDKQISREFSLPNILLMENAGGQALEVLLKLYPEAGLEQDVVVLAGRGQNGGDACVVARRLAALERKVRVFLLSDPSLFSGSCDAAFQSLKAAKVRWTRLESANELNAFFQSLGFEPIVIDGIFGTGLNSTLEGTYRDVVNATNEATSKIISLDLPSGICADTGEVRGVAIQAQATVSFGFPKLGHFLPPGATRRGKLFNADISVPLSLKKEGQVRLLSPGSLNHLLRERDKYGHKNSFGHVLLIGGSPGRTGAISMSARATHRMGAGLVTVASWSDSLEQVQTRLPDETMSLPIILDGKGLEEYRSGVPQYSAIVIGPGLGNRSQAKDLLETLLKSYQGPTVLDADALNVLSEHRQFDLISRRTAPTVLTPHPGEMARLIGRTKEEVVSQPLEALKEASQRTNAIVILKGAATLIHSKEDVTYLNHYPNDGMATAGSGDVLAGMIGGLLGQKISGSTAALLGVYLHSLAGEHAAHEFGHRSMTAGDIINSIPAAYAALKAENEKSRFTFDPILQLL